MDVSLSPVWRLLYRRLLSLLSNEVIKLEAKPKVGCAYKCDAKGGSERGEEESSKDTSKQDCIAYKENNIYRWGC